jgi:hypothetical protein
VEGAGAVDNLYISPNGGLTLVETKLWKNPEARREVVAQIIDYTRRIVHWDYTTLDNGAKDYLHKYESWDGSLYDWLEGKFKDIPPESEFIDRTSKNLRYGRFLLLIVGDGIRQAAEEMVSYIQETPQLQFRLALVEMGCYRPSNKEWPLVMVPHLVAKTKEVERAVVRIEISDEAAKRVEITTTVSPIEPTLDPSEEGFFSDLAKAIQPQPAEKVRQFVQNMKAMSGIEIRVAKELAIFYNLERCGALEPLKILAFARRGDVRLRLMKRERQNPVICRLTDSFWVELGKVHPSLPPRMDEQGEFTASWVPICKLIDKLDEVLTVVKEFVAAVESEDLGRELQ